MGDLPFAVPELIDEAISRGHFSGFAVWPCQCESIGAHVKGIVAADMNDARIDHPFGVLFQKLDEIFADLLMVCARLIGHRRK